MSDRRSGAATQRRRPQVRDDEAALTSAIERLATQYGRYGYRRIGRTLVDEGWRVNVKRCLADLAAEGLKVPKKQPKRGRLWLNDGSCVRLRPERSNHVWSYDFSDHRRDQGDSGAAKGCGASPATQDASGAAGSARKDTITCWAQGELGDTKCPMPGMLMIVALDNLTAAAFAKQLADQKYRAGGRVVLAALLRSTHFARCSPSAIPRRSQAGPNRLAG